jgi:hypothetical protein
MEGNVRVLKGYKGLVECIGRDACDAGNIWKAVAFHTLAGLWDLFERVGGGLLDDFRGFMRSFVGGLRDCVGGLEDEHIVVGYEGIITLFLRMAGSVQGADCLFESGVVEVLAECRFVRDVPENDGEYEGSRMQRYHRVLIPLLRVVASIGVKAGSVFVDLFGGVLVGLLKSKASGLAGLEVVELITGIYAMVEGEDERLVGVMGRVMEKYGGLEWIDRFDAATEHERMKEGCGMSVGGVRARNLFASEVEMVGLGIIRNVVVWAVKNGVELMGVARVLSEMLGRLESCGLDRAGLSNLARMGVDEVEGICVRSSEVYERELSGEEMVICAGRQVERDMERKEGRLRVIVEGVLVLV